MTPTPPHFALKVSQPRSSHTRRTVFQTATLRSGVFLMMPLLMVVRPAFGQAVPTATASPISTGFELPSVAGTLTFAVGANESLSWGYYGNGVASSTGVNADVAYLSPSQRRPFSAIFSGGRSWSQTGQASPIYLNLALSQVFGTKTWSFVASDSVSYVPQTPSVGLSGIPGVGDLGVPPVQVGTDTGQGLLTVNAPRVGNVTSLSAQHRLTASTSVQATASYSLLTFLGTSTSDAGISSKGESATVGASHRLSARNTLSTNYGYSRFTFGTGQGGFVSQTVSVELGHQFSPRFSMDASIGPEWTSSFGTPQDFTTTNVAASLQAAYSTLFANFTLVYSRGTNSGSGVVTGARSDSVLFSASRTFARVWSTSFTSGYTRTTSLGPTNGTHFTPQTLVDSIQTSRALGHGLSAYASYTLENQSSAGSGVNLFSGTSKTASLGVTYSPRSIHLGSR